MTDSNNSEITRDDPSAAETSDSVELITSNLPDTNSVIGIHKFTVTTISESQNNNNNENANISLNIIHTNLSVSNSHSNPGTSAVVNSPSSSGRLNFGACSFPDSEVECNIRKPGEATPLSQNDPTRPPSDVFNNATELHHSRSNTNSTPSLIAQCSSQYVSRSLINSPRSSRSSTIPAPHQYADSRAHRCCRVLMGCNDHEIAIPFTVTEGHQGPPSFEDTINISAVNITPPPGIPHVQHGPPPLAGAPPSYSAVMRIGPRDDDPPWPHTDRTPIRIQPSPPFIAPIPPPTYSQAQGFQVERPVIIASVDQMVFGPTPLSVICPRCAHVVVTSTESHRSNLTHFTALALCLCGCWPCCLLPYCMDSCKNTYHHCPNCQQFLGMYRPW